MTRWAGLSHAELHAMVVAGPGPSASAAAERAWREAAGVLAELHHELADQVRALPAGWSGIVGDGVAGALTAMAAWTGTASVEAGRTADALAAQATLATDLRARMPAAPMPGPPEVAPAGTALLHDWAVADAATDNAAARAAELMQRYDDDTRATGRLWAGWAAPPVLTREDAGSVTAVPAGAGGGTGRDGAGPGFVAGPGVVGGPAAAGAVVAGVGVAGVGVAGVGVAGGPAMAGAVLAGGWSRAAIPADRTAGARPGTALITGTADSARLPAASMTTGAITAPGPGPGSATSGAPARSHGSTTAVGAGPRGTTTAAGSGPHGATPAAAGSVPHVLRIAPGPGPARGGAAASADPQGSTAPVLAGTVVGTPAGTVGTARRPGDGGSEPPPATAPGCAEHGAPHSPPGGALPAPGGQSAPGGSAGPGGQSGFSGASGPDGATGPGPGSGASAGLGGASSPGEPIAPSDPGVPGSLGLADRPTTAGIGDMPREPVAGPFFGASGTPAGPDVRGPAWRAVVEHHPPAHPDDHVPAPADGDAVLRPEQRWRGRG